jgi:large repetitive protein
MSEVTSKTMQVGIARALAVAFSVIVAVVLLMTMASATLAVTAPAAPVIVSPPEGSYDNDGAFTLSGTAKAYTIVQVFDASSGMKLGNVSVNALGNWQLSLSGRSDGKHAYKARVYSKSDGGVYSDWSNTRTVIVDTKAPAAPSIAAPFEGEISGTAEASSTVELFEGTTSLGTVQADGQGNWNKQVVVKLQSDTYYFKARATDLAGNVSGWSNTCTINVEISEKVEIPQPDGTSLSEDG